MEEKLNGLVLTGGRSTRMGRDKGLLDYHGRPQREHLFQLLKGVCSEVYTSCRSDQDIPPHYNKLPDATDLYGPMNGVMSALNFRPAESWFLVAVDMPNVDESSIEFLLKHRDVNKIATCFYNPFTQTPEPLFTILEANAYPYLHSFIEKGNVSLREFLRTHKANMVTVPDLKILVNINTEEERSRR